MSSFDTLGGDDKEPVHPTTDHMHFISRDEFAKLCEDVTNTRIDIAVIKGYIEERKEQSKNNKVITGIIAGCVSAIVAVINRVW